MPTKDESRDMRPAPTMPEAVTSTAAWAIQHLDAELRTAIDGVLADLGDLPDQAKVPVLSLRGYRLLEAIGPAPAHSQRELCDLLGIDRSDMVRLVDVLEDAGLVERVRDTGDRRRQLIGPTKSGAKRRDAIRAGIAEAEGRVFAAVPAPMRAALEAALAGPVTDDAAEQPDPAPKKSGKKRKNKKKGGKRQ